MIYVVIATINNLEHLQALLMALSKVELPLRIVIVDNGSEAAMAEWLGQFGRGGVQVIFNERNIGAAAAWNLGIRVALANAASAILVCGSDTQPFPGTVERLAAHLKAGVPFITGTAVPYDSPELRDPIALPGPDDVLFAAPDFSFFMLNPVMIETVARWDASLEWAVLKETKERPAVLPPPWTWGLFDERFYPAYFEDNDFHLRMHRAGLLAARDPAALFAHNCSLTINTHPDLARLNREVTFARNADLFKAKWGGTPQEVAATSARPLNISEAEWHRQTGGRAVMQLPQSQLVAQAEEVYSRYGIMVRSDAPA